MNHSTLYDGAYMLHTAAEGRGETTTKVNNEGLRGWGGWVFLRKVSFY